MAFDNREQLDLNNRIIRENKYVSLAGLGVMSIMMKYSSDVYSGSVR